MSFRFSFASISPPFLSKGVAEKIKYSIGLILDAYSDAIREGVKARFPGVGTYDALPFIGRDRNIERGPTESNAGYAERLGLAFDTWRSAGNAFTILTQLRAFFSPSNGPPMRAVSNRAVWHEIDPATGDVTKTVVGDNWQWDAFAQTTPRTRNHRGWIIIEGSDLWEIDVWGEDDTYWGDGGVWGSNMTSAEGEALSAIIKKWKSAYNFVPTTIVTFDADLFQADNATADNPKSPENWNEPEIRIPIAANFWPAIRT